MNTSAPPGQSAHSRRSQGEQELAPALRSILDASWDPAGVSVQRNLCASDAERHAVARRLERALRDGRLTIVEFDERAGAYAAHTRGDLEDLTEDLPADLW